MSKKLLLADDSVVIQKLVGLSFANENIEIISTDNGDDAVTLARDLHPDVILADVVMPGLSGYEVCEAIKQDAALSHTPVLLLTGTFEAFDEARAAAVGANGQITKPFEARALVEHVNGVMNASVEVTVPAESMVAEETIFAPVGHDSSASIPGAIEDATSSSSDLFNSGVTSITGDSLASLGNDLLAPPPLPIDTAVDFESVLDAGGPDGDATILVSNDDIVTTTSPNLHDPLADSFEATDGFDDLTVHAPLADIDQDVSTANSPEFNDSANPTGASALDALDDIDVDATIVANLDEALAEPTLIDAAPADSGFVNGQYSSADPFTPSAIAAAESTIVETNPLGFAPTRIASDEVDFAFDVSEQIAANDLSETASVSPASFGDSFSSLMDISDSPILSASPAAPRPAIPDEADTIRAAYDVSSSDLATAPATDLTQVEDTFAGSGGSPATAPIPEPEALIEVPELPQSYSPLQNASDDDSITGSASLFDDLATGSPLDELDVPNAFASAGDLDIDHDLLNYDLSGRPSASRNGVADFEADLEQAESYSTDEPAAAPELIRAASDDEFELGAHLSAKASAIDGFGGQAGPEAREHSVPDITPMMEQRIQETLEKVAWEAFSDLSESIVKQVMGRVEQIAWEVIPEMAETLVREEIRKMKGDDK